MSVEGDRKQSVDAKLKKQCFSYTSPNVFALNGRHLGFAPTGHAFDHSSQQSRSIISMHACVFATKTMAVRIFRSGKISNFGGIFFPIVHLFRLGSKGF